jgi:hypothetical protein
MEEVVEERTAHPKGIVKITPSATETLTAESGNLSQASEMVLMIWREIHPSVEKA